MRYITTFISVFLLLGFSSFASENDLCKDEYSSRSKKNAIKWQNELRTQLSFLLKIDDLIEEKQKPELNPVLLKTENKQNYILKEIEINSTSTRRIKIILTIPINAQKKYPAVFAIAGHGGNRFSTYEIENIYHGFASALAENEFVTASVDVGQHNIYEANRTLMGERVWDLMRCVDYLESLPNVDKHRMGCGGLSLGGEMAMWLGALDTRMKAVVSSGFLTFMDQMEKNHCMCWKFDGLRDLVDYPDIYSLIAPRFLQCQNGMKEPSTDFTPQLAKEALKKIEVIYADFDKKQNVELIVHEGGHEIDLPGLLSFFKKHL